VFVKITTIFWQTDSTAPRVMKQHVDVRRTSSFITIVVLTATITVENAIREENARFVMDAQF